MLPERVGSSLRDPGRHVVIVTTASLPWRTGTAVNPLLRAAFTAQILDQSKVTLLVPWLAISEQKLIFPDGLTFAKPEDQRRWVFDWVEQRTSFRCSFELKFYAARYDGQGFFSIFPVGDVTECIPAEEADVAILEEPEHLTWFHHGRRWTNKFRHVVGIIHTNYVDYIRREVPAAAPVIALANRRMCSIHCHKVVKLSDAVQKLPRQATCFCHGVPQAFLDVGKRMRAEGKECTSVTPSVSAEGEEGPLSASLSTGASGGVNLDVGNRQQAGELPANGHSDRDTATQGRQEEKNLAERFSKGAYFLGKGVWGKGYTELLSLLAEHQRQGGKPLPVDVYGSGEDMDAIKSKAKKDNLAITFNPGRDHLDDAIHAYRVFVNPSTSDVVATTSAEALAMGKWVICAEHPSNAFFKETFANCLVYTSPEEFAEKLLYAEEHDPKPLTEDEIKRLTWEDATQRFLDAVEIGANEWPNRFSEFKNSVTWPIINAGVGIEAIRRVIGAGKNTAKAPESLESFDPANRDVDWENHIALGYPEPRVL